MEREHYEESDTGHAIKRASEEQRVVEENGGKHGGARIRLPGKPDEERRAQVDHQRQKARLWRKKRATFGAKCKEKAQSVNCLPNPRNIPKPRKGNSNEIRDHRATSYYVVAIFRNYVMN